MLDAVRHDTLPAQPLLPLLELALHPAPPRRGAKRRSARAKAPAIAWVNTLMALSAPAPGQLSADAVAERLARRVYLAMAACWELTGPEALALLGEPEAGEAERRERLRLLMGVNRMLQLLHPEPGRDRAFLHGPHPAFGGTAPLALMLAGGLPDMTRVVSHLVAKAGW